VRRATSGVRAHLTGQVRLKAIKEIPMPATGKEEDWDLTMLSSLDDGESETACAMPPHSAPPPKCCA
jgi:hypothetical protein